MVARKVSLFLLGLLVAVAYALVAAAHPASAAAEGCEAGIASDFNGDGRSDAVIADPYATVGGAAEAGRVIVLYGASDGLIGEGVRDVVAQGMDRVSGTPDAGDRFGFALAVGDLNCDEYTDLVVGTPDEDVGAASDSGYVQVIWGAATGLGTGDTSTQYTQRTFGNAVTAGDQFGYALDVVEDLGQGGTPAPHAYALAIGAPGTNVSGHNDAGWVGVLHAVEGANIPVEFTQDTPGLPGSAEAGDRFGAAVAAGHLVRTEPGQDTLDVVVGAPHEDVGPAADAGSFTLVADVYDDFTSATAYDQNSPNVPGAAEPGDRFGEVLETVLVGDTARLAVGVPLEDVATAVDAGSVQLFSSDIDDAALDPGATLTQNTAGLGEIAEAGDRFGATLAFAAPGLGDPVTRLGVGVPDEDGESADQGMVSIFPVTDLDGGSSYSQASPGVPGDVGDGDHFGRTLAFVSGISERAFLVGVPDDSDNRSGMVNVIPLGGGLPRFWAPGTNGLPTGGVRFGDTLGSVQG